MGTVVSVERYNGSCVHRYVDWFCVEHTKASEDQCCLGGLRQIEESFRSICSDVNTETEVSYTAILHFKPRGMVYIQDRDN